MAIQLVVFVSCLTVFATQAFAQQQRPVLPAFTRSGQGRLSASLELDPEQPQPQPFRRVSLPLYRGRGFSLDGQEPKLAPQQTFQPSRAAPQQAFQTGPAPQQTFQPRPTPQQAFQPRPVSYAPVADDGNESIGRADGGDGTFQDDAAAAAAVDTEVPRPTRLQGPPHYQLPERGAPLQPQATVVDRADRIHAQQVDRVQQQHIDRVQQQQIDRAQLQQPEKPFPSFRPQPKIQMQPSSSVEPQPQFVRKVVQKQWQKRVQTEETVAAASKNPETIQRLKVERTESADKQRAKKPVSQVLRRYRDDNPDGSITWGFENDDGTFKEETIGADCVTRGKYGYVDPEGVKREYTYQSGLPCDKNRVALSASGPSGRPSQAVQEAQASDSHGYIDYTKNQYVMANGQTISLNGMARNRARKPVVRKTAIAASTAGPQQQ